MSDSSLARRTFLTTTGAGVLAAATATGASDTESAPGSLDRLTADEMDRLVGTPFVFQRSAREQITFHLVDNLRLASRGERPRHLPRQQAFLARLQGPLNHGLVEGTYLVQHAALGRVLLYLCPGDDGQVTILFN